MMGEVRELRAGELGEFVRIASNAYPGMEIVTAEDRENARQRMTKVHDDPARRIFGHHRDGRVLGVMILYDFQMNLLDEIIPAGGIGQVAVDLLHKKEHVAKEMMSFSLEYFRQRNVPMIVLYPFRHDFYMKMGFGYGPKVHYYRLDPAALPRGESKEHVRFLDASDREAVSACYARRFVKTNGMLAKAEWEMDRLFQAPGVQIVGHVVDGHLTGYLAYRFIRRGSFLDNDLRVIELVYDDRHALSELLTFLSTQADQIGRIELSTYDESFYHLLSDPRNDSGNIIHPVYLETNTQGTGLMYRVVDTAAIFRALKSRNFGGQNCSLALTIEDDFLPVNSGSINLQFVDGRLSLKADSKAEVEIRMNIAEFSALIPGIVRFEDLWTYGLAEISDTGYVDIVDALFRTDRKPECVTQF